MTFHTDDPGRAESAFDRLAADSDGTVVMLDATLTKSLREHP